MKTLLIKLIRFYRRYISPYKPACCRFEPTCSAYALEAFTKRGFFAALLLTTWRILRCNPFGKGGYDPVPDKGFKRVTLSNTGENETNGVDANESCLHHQQTSETK